MKSLTTEKIINIIFIICIAILFSFPYIFAHRYTRNSNSQVAAAENRNLEQPTAIFDGASLNMSFPSEYDRWFSDHLGLRSTLININACMDYYLFNQFPDSTNRAIGKTGIMVDGSNAIIQSYAHTNLLSNDELVNLGNSCQTVNDWLANQGIQFYFVQNVERHEIYSADYLGGINQIGDISKQDQIINYLRNNTDVQCIYTKDILLENKDIYKIYNTWSDYAHWTDRGAYLGYLDIMNAINEHGNNLKVLTEDDYDIEIINAGEYVYNYLYKDDIKEQFSIKNPAVQVDPLTNYTSEKYGFEIRNIYDNPNSGVTKKVLIFSDSYFYMFISDDIAESFSITWDVPNNSFAKLPEILNIYEPDIVILEIAQRNDSYSKILNLADKIKSLKL